MASSTTSEDRRTASRYPIRVELKLLAPEQHTLLLSHTMDISLFGALVRANREIPVGASVRVSLYREEPYYPLQLDAEVVRIAAGDAERFPGIGLRFAAMSESEQELLRDLIARRGNIEVEALPPPGTA